MRKFVKERTDEIETLPSIKSQKINSNSIATALHIQTIVDPNENSLIIPISGSYNFNFNLDKNFFFSTVNEIQDLHDVKKYISDTIKLQFTQKEIIFEYQENDFTAIDVFFEFSKRRHCH